MAKNTNTIVYGDLNCDERGIVGSWIFARSVPVMLLDQGIRDDPVLVNVFN